MEIRQPFPINAGGMRVLEVWTSAMLVTHGEQLIN